MNDDLLITGFTAFGSFATNPAESIGRRVAAQFAARFEPLEVSYDAVDHFIESLVANPPARWLMLGVAGNSDVVRWEGFARNWVGVIPDVRGVVRGPGKISLTLGDSMAGTLQVSPKTLPDCCRHSDHAGDYLCNFLYWLALSKLPRTAIAFIHVAPTDCLAENDQVTAVIRLLDRTPAAIA